MSTQTSRAVEDHLVEALVVASGHGQSNISPRCAVSDALQVQPFFLLILLIIIHFSAPRI